MHYYTWTSFVLASVQHWTCLPCVYSWNADDLEQISGTSVRQKHGWVQNPLVVHKEQVLTDSLKFNQVSPFSEGTAMN